MLEHDYQEVFKENNMELAINLRELIVKTVDKAHELVSKSRSLTDLSSAIKIAETAGKITGIVKEQDTIDLTVNQISGFTFVQIGNIPPKEPLRSIEEATLVEYDTNDDENEEYDEEDDDDAV